MRVDIYSPVSEGNRSGTVRELRFAVRVAKLTSSEDICIFMVYYSNILLFGEQDATS
jgi:hypothetical protein